MCTTFKGEACPELGIMLRYNQADSVSKHTEIFFSVDGIEVMTFN